MTRRPCWSEPHPPAAPPIVIVLSTLGFAAVLGYETTRAVIAIYERLTGGKL